MGSLASSSRQLQLEQDEDSPQLYCVYASFSTKSSLSSSSESLNWIECFNMSTNRWNRVTSIPVATEMNNHVLKGFAMVILDDFIYIIGGYLCCQNNHFDHEVDDQQQKQLYRFVLRYSIIDDTWSKCAPLKQPRFDFACAVSGGKIYVAGGKCTTDSVRGVSSAEVYDPALDEWKSLPSMTTSRYNCVGVSWQDKFYVVGGFADRGVSGPFTMARSSAEVYDTLTNTWVFLPRMWELDVPPNQIVVAGGKLFSSGDCYKRWKGFIEKYDRDLNMWNVVDGSSLLSPTSMLDVTSPERTVLTEQMYLTIAPIGTRLYFFAGYQMIGESSRLFKSEVHAFNVSDGGVWTSFEPKMENGEKELSCHCCVYKKA